MLAGIALLAPLAWAALSPPGANDFVGGDEGYYTVMARAIAADPGQALAVPRHPGGGPGDKPPGWPLALAAVGRVAGFGEAAMRWPSLVAAAFVMLGAGLLAGALAGEWAAVSTALVLATLPWFADASRVVAAEIPLAALGVWALVVIEPAPSARRAFGAGVLLGLGFATKLWLVAPFALAALLRLWPFRRPAPVLALAAGFALPALAHPAAVALRAPEQLAHWRDVYLAFSLRDRVAGEGYAEYWRQPADFYVRQLLHAFVLALPLVAAGAFARLRALREPGTRLLLGWLAGLAMLSAFAIKTGGYAYPLVPGFAVLAGLGAAALARRARPLALLLVALAVAGGAWRTAQRLPLRYHDPGYAEAARALEPWLAGVPAESVAVLAPEAPAFEAYLFRRARYWDTPYDPWSPERAAALRAGGRPFAWVTDEDRRFYGGGPDPATIGWLEAHARELTDDVARAHGRRPGVRVFVADPARTGPLVPAGVLR